MTKTHKQISGEFACSPHFQMDMQQASTATARRRSLAHAWIMLFPPIERLNPGDILWMRWREARHACSSKFAEGKFASESVIYKLMPSETELV